jgi:hypothetical protein
MPGVDGESSAPARAAANGHTLRGLRAAGRFLLQLPWLAALPLPFLWMALIWSLSSHHVPLPVEGSPFWELMSNLAHAPLYGLLGLFAATLLLRGGGEWPTFRPRRWCSCWRSWWPTARSTSGTRATSRGATRRRSTSSPTSRRGAGPVDRGLSREARG